MAEIFLASYTTPWDMIRSESANDVIAVQQGGSNPEQI